MATDNNDLIISHLSLRKAIGWLGILLPFMLLIGNLSINQLDILNNSFFVKTDCGNHYEAGGFFKASISHYYYSGVGELFTGILGTVALFMFCYKGHVKRPGEKGLSDNALTNLATNNTGAIHFTMAAMFFISLSLMSIVNFRRTGDRVSFGKKETHNLFLVCGIAMLVCLALIFIYSLWLEGDVKWLDRLHPVFCLEAIALIFFGISWLTKGKVDIFYLPKLLKLKK